MDKIFMDAKDKNVAKTIIYANGNAEKAYKDPECNVEFTVNELRDAFLKGAVVQMTDIDEDVLAIPLNYIAYDSENAMIMCQNGSADTTVVLWVGEPQK